MTHTSGHTRIAWPRQEGPAETHSAGPEAARYDQANAEQTGGLAHSGYRRSSGTSGSEGREL